VVDALADGIERSATFRALVDRVNASDLIVYVERIADLDERLDGQLIFITTAGGRRYLRVQINARLWGEREVAILAHELEHAVEIADAPGVVDETAMAGFYARSGARRTAMAGRVQRFETDQAIAAARQVRHELRAAVAADEHDAARTPRP
jgi:hypothetical protein